MRVLAYIIFDLRRGCVSRQFTKQQKPNEETIDTMNYTYKTIAAVAIACGIIADSINAQGTNSVSQAETATPQVAETVTEEAPSGPNVYAFSYAKNGYLCDGYLIYDDIVLQSGAGVTWRGSMSVSGSPPV